PDPQLVGENFGGQQPIIRTKREMGASGRSTEQLLPRVRVPEPQHPFPTPAAQLVAGMVKREPDAPTLAPLQLGRLFAGGHIPELNAPLAAGRRQHLALGVPPNRPAPSQGKLRKPAPRLQIVDLNTLFEADRHVPLRGMKSHTNGFSIDFHLSDPPD